MESLLADVSYTRLSADCSWQTSPSSTHTKCLVTSCTSILSPLNGHFSRWTRLSRFHCSNDDGSGGDNWSYKPCKAPVKSSPPTNQHPTFLHAGCPSCRPTNSVKAFKGIISHFTDLLTPSSSGVFQLCLRPLKAPGYLGVPCLSSALWWWQYPNALQFCRQQYRIDISAYFYWQHCA